MEDFIRILEVVLPVLLIVIFGYMGKKIGLLKDEFIKEGSKLVFKLFMPVNMFVSIYKSSGLDIVRLDLVFFAVLALLGILLIFNFVFSKMNFDVDTKAVMLQSLIRSNIVLYGLSIAKNYFDQDGVAVVAIYIGVISAFTNSFAIILHESMSLSGKKSSMKVILKNILKNTILISVFLGILINYTGIKIYNPLFIALEDISRVATPLGLLCIGASIRFPSEVVERKAMKVFLLNKCLIVPFVLLTIFYFIGFKGPEMFFIIIFFATPVAISSHVLSCIYTSKGDFSAKLIVYSTIINSLTVFLAIYIFSSLGVI